MAAEIKDVRVALTCDFAPSVPIQTQQASKSKVRATLTSFLSAAIMDVSQGLPNKHNAAGSSEKLGRAVMRLNRRLRRLRRKRNVP